MRLSYILLPLAICIASLLTYSNVEASPALVSTVIGDYNLPVGETKKADKGNGDKEVAKEAKQKKAKKVKASDFKRPQVSQPTSKRKARKAKTSG